jgi:hypothetical protein
MTSSTAASRSSLVLALAGALAGLGFFLVAAKGAGAPPLAAAMPMGAALCLAALLVGVLALRDPEARHRGEWALALLVALATGLALSTLWGLSFYVRFPADFLGFWEGDYLTDLIEFRAGLPLYGPVADNNSSVYTPGAQLLTYGLASLTGADLDVVTLRAIQFSYVVAAALVATSACDHLARRFLAPGEYVSRPLWLAAWFPLLVLVGVERRFNLNVHTLHPDSLTLLLSAAAFWLLARHALRPSPWVVTAMALLPAVGFWSKQSLVIWMVLFGGYLVLAERRWKEIALFAALAPLFLAVSLWLLFRVGGPQTGYWIFGILGDKAVGLGRSLDAFVAAGGFVAASLVGLWVLILRDRSWPALLLWLIPTGLLLVQCYTTGIGWQKNHLGPGVLMAACFGLAALPRLWARLAAVTELPIQGLGRLAFALGIGLVPSALGLVREPANKVPAAALAQVAAIEEEFRGMDPHRVLLDRGSWVYVKDTVIMRDRASSVQLHLGANSPQMNLAAIQATLGRIRAEAYDKILVREFPQGSPYDWHVRGSGIPDALAEHYVVVRTIPGVPELDEWWPKRLLMPITVLVPRSRASLAASLPDSLQVDSR